MNSFFSIKVIGRIIAAFCTIFGFALISSGINVLIYNMVTYGGLMGIFFILCIACGFYLFFASYKMWNGVAEENLNKLQPMIIAQCIGIPFSLYPMLALNTTDYLFGFLPFLIILLVATLIVFVKIENKILTAEADEVENQNFERISCGLRIECFGRFISMIFVNVGSGGAFDVEITMMACYMIYGALAFIAGWVLWTGITQRNPRRILFMLVTEFCGIILLIPSYCTNYQHSNVLAATLIAGFVMIVAFFYTYNLYHLIKDVNGNKLRKNQNKFFSQQQDKKIIN